MRATEILAESNLFELFDSSADDLKQVQSSDKFVVWEFSVDGTKYRITMKKDGVHYELDYGIITSDNRVDFEPSNEQDHAFKVLGTVVKVVESFIKHNQVASIGFKGNKGAKLGYLYQQMAKILKNRVNKLGFTIAHYDGGMYDDFFIENTKYDFENEEFVE